jgi:hypothetical protein
MKKLLLIFILVILLSCKKNEVVDIDMDLKCPTVARVGSNTQAEGKWKLLQGSTVFYDTRTVDYSCNEVIYDFRSNGIVIITSDIQELIGTNPGDHSYEFTRKPLFEGGNYFTIKINTNSVSCRISDGLMTLDDSAFDGPILHLARM